VPRCSGVPEDFTARIDRLERLSLKLYREANIWRTRLAPIMLADRDAYRITLREAAQRVRAAADVLRKARRDYLLAIIDLVTTHDFNLYRDLLELLGQADPALGPEPPPLYAVACRSINRNDTWRLETWGTH
jgi:hypothetical protein